MKFEKRITLSLAAGLVGAMALVGSSFASSHEGGHEHETLTGVYKERHDAMEGMGKAVKSTVAMLKGEAPWDEAQIKANAEKIEATAGDPILALFPEGTNAGKSEALDKIWQDWAGFSTAAHLLKERAGAHAAASTKEEVGATFGAMTKACGGCHETYRVKKD